MRLIQKGQMMRVEWHEAGGLTIHRGRDFVYFDAQQVEQARILNDTDEAVIEELLADRVQESEREGDPKWIASDRDMLARHRAVTARVRQHQAVGQAFSRPRSGRTPRRAARRAVRAGPVASAPPEPPEEPPGSPSSKRRTS
jgi:hypothetical protein